MTAIVLAAFALRIWHITAQPLWLDEGYTLIFSALSLPRLILVGGAHEHPPLYYLVIHVLDGIATGPWTPRYVSLAASALQVPALYWVARRMCGRTASVTAALLLAVAPLHVWFAHDGRAYELAGLLVLISYGSALTALQRGSVRWWLAYAITTSLALYTEYTTALVLLPQVALWFWTRRHRRLVASWSASALLFAPWLATLAEDARSVAASYWVPRPTPQIVGRTAQEFVGMAAPCIRPPCTGNAGPLTESHLLQAAVLPAAALVLAAGVLLAWRTRSRVAWMLWLWITVPFAAILVLAPVRSLFLDRVFLDATFPLYIAAAALATAQRFPLMVKAIPALIMLGGSLLTLPTVYGGSNPDIVTPAHDLAAAYNTQESVIYYPGVLQPMVLAYTPRGWRPQLQRPVWLHAYLDVPGWRTKYGDMSDDQLRDLEFRSATRSGRIWLVAQGYTGLPEARHWFTAHGYTEILSEIYRGGTRLDLYERHPLHGFGPAITRVHYIAVGPGRPLRRSFAVHERSAYVTYLSYRVMPPGLPAVSVRVVDAHNRLLGTYPRTRWYDLPASGVWLSQPFGFVTPPGAARATLQLRSAGGETQWRNLSVQWRPATAVSRRE